MSEFKLQLTSEITSLKTFKILVYILIVLEMPNLTILSIKNRRMKFEHFELKKCQCPFKHQLNYLIPLCFFMFGFVSFQTVGSRECSTTPVLLTCIGLFTYHRKETMALKKLQLSPTL